MPMPIRLAEVFGIFSSIPQYTYVDRDNLDAKFQYLLSTERHLVIYGASKQGKTVLRRKNLVQKQTVEIQCRLNMQINQFYKEILRQLGSRVPGEMSESIRGGIKGESEAQIPIIVKANIEAGFEVQKDTKFDPLMNSDAISLDYLASEIKQKGKRIIVEDFHYLGEEERKHFAFDLKAFHDLGVFFIIIGVWAEQNLLLMYNGDLSGRIEEIDVQWKLADLSRVIQKGEEALRIEFSTPIKEALISDANENVGLLQRLLEAFCREEGVLYKQTSKMMLIEIQTLDLTRKKISDDQAARYRNFFTIISEGLRSGDLRMYEQIVRVCVELATDRELIKGIVNNVQFLQRIHQFQPSARASDLTQALQRIKKVQVDKDVVPLIFDYNESSKSLQLLDRELLFYRKYYKGTWPWDVENTSDIDDQPND